MSELKQEATRRVADRSGWIASLRWKVQLASFLLLNALVLKDWRGYRLKGACVPVLNCHGCPAAAAYCPVGVVGDMVGLRMIPWLALGAFGLVAMLFGRLTCGWVCPFGALQDLMAKIPVPKWKPPRWTRFIKYAVLIGMVFVAPLFMSTAGSQMDGVAPPVASSAAAPADLAPPAAPPDAVPGPPGAAPVVPPPVEAGPGGGAPPMEAAASEPKEETAKPQSFNWFFCTICPDATIVASGWYLAAEYIETGTIRQVPWRRLISLGVFLLLMLFVVRGFCRIVCPIGAGLAPFNRVSLLSLKFKKRWCSECMQCVRQCPVDIGPMADPRSGECIYCGDCFKCHGIGMDFGDEDAGKAARPGGGD